MSILTGILLITALTWGVVGPLLGVAPRCARAERGAPRGARIAGIHMRFPDHPATVPATVPYPPPPLDVAGPRRSPGRRRVPLKPPRRHCRISHAHHLRFSAVAAVR